MSWTKCKPFTSGSSSVSSPKPGALSSPLETKLYFGVLPPHFQTNVYKLVGGAALQGCGAENEALQWFFFFFAVLGMDLMVWESTRLGLAKAPSKGGSELVPVVGNWAEPSINGANPAQLPECLKKDLERKLHY